MLSEIAKFVKDFYNKNFRDIMLFVIVCLLLMLAFASGYIVAKTQQIEPIRIEKSN
jgi:predicted Na+-dependent transporter